MVCEPPGLDGIVNDELDKDAVSDDEIIAECKARFKVCEEAEGENRNNALDDLSFCDGNQWPDDVTNVRKNRPTPVINHTKSFVRRVVNNIRQLRPRIKCHPANDGASIEVAEVINGLIKHIENISTASIAYDTGAESAIKVGWGYWRIVSEYCDESSFDQDIKIKPIRNIFQVYMDPGALMPAGEDQMWCVMTGMMKRTLYKGLYPNAPNKDFMLQAAGDQTSSWETKEELRVAEYYRIREKPEKLYKMVDSSTAFASDVKKACAEKHIAKDSDGKPIYRDSFKRQVEWFRINGETIADRRVLPGRFIPIIRCEGNVIDLNGKVLRSGMIRDLKDPQRNFNYMTAAKIERLALTPKAPWTVFEDQIDGHPEWFDANQKNYSVLVHKAVIIEGQLLPPPQRQQPAGLEAGFSEAAQSSEHDLVAIAGMPHEPGQDSPGQVVSGAAIQRRQAISDSSHFQYSDNASLAQSQTGRVLLDWIKVIYDVPRMMRIIGDDDTPEMVGINQPQAQTDENGQPQMDQEGQAIMTIKNDLTVGSYDVVMDSGPGYQTQREEGAENLMTLVGTPELGKKISDVGSDLVVRSIDGPYMQELADRLAVTSPQGMDKMVKGLPKQAQAVVQTLQAQLKQAQSKIQEQEMDLKYGLTKTMHQEATKLQIEASRDQRAEKDTHTDTFTKLEDTHTKAHTAIAVAEIGAGATLIDTRLQAEHEKGLAKMTAEAAEKAESVN